MKNINYDIRETVNKLTSPIIIGVSGFGGSGKSTISNIISKETNAPVIGVDSFYLGDLDKYKNWDIFDYKRLEKDILIPFSSGISDLRFKEFDWETNTQGKIKHIKCNNAIIIEGVGLLRPSLLKYFSLKIWIKCSIHESIRRGKNRDKFEYNNPQDELWDGIWKNNDLQCYKDFNIESNVDIIVNHETQGIVFLDTKMK